MNILYLSDILNVHDERLLSQFRAAGHTVTLLTFFHRAPELPKFIGELGLTIIHEKYATYPDGAGASRAPGCGACVPCWRSQERRS